MPDKIPWVGDPKPDRIGEYSPEDVINGFLIPWLTQLENGVEALSHVTDKKTGDCDALEVLKTQLEDKDRTIADLERIIENYNEHVRRLQEENAMLRSGNPVTYHVEFVPDGD